MLMGFKRDQPKPQDQKSYQDYEREIEDLQSLVGELRLQLYLETRHTDALMARLQSLDKNALPSRKDKTE